MGTVIILCITFVLILLSVINNISVLYPLIACLVITGISRTFYGYSIKDICKMGINGFRKSAIIYKMFVLIGTIISVWIASGTVPGLMYYGFMLVKPGLFIAIAFLLTSTVSMILGTSFGTVSTIGIALMAVGRGFGINPGIISGAIISGAYLGDRSSPMSSSAILTSVITDSNLYDNLRHMVSTLTPAFLISLVLYYITSSSGGAISPDMTRVVELQNAISGNFSINLLVLVPPIVIMVLPFFKVNIKLNMLIGIAIGGLIAVFMQKVHFYQLIYYMVFGYKHQFTNPLLSQIIKGGGILSMVKVSLIIGVSSALNGIFEGTRMLDGILIFFQKKIKNIGNLVFYSALISIITAMYGCSQTLSIMLTGQIIKPAFKSYNVSNVSLARTIADTSVVLSPMVPWNIAGLVPAVSLGVKVTDFMPYAYLCLIFPIISVIFSYMGLIKMTPVNNEGQYCN